MNRGIELNGAVVVITGASSGIGRATAWEFARRGSHLVLAARDEQTLRDSAHECRAAGARAIAVPTDVADATAVDNLAHRAVGEFGRIDVWVNNAAVMAYGAIGDVPPAVQERIIDTNLLGAMYGAHTALRTMREHGEGVIVNVASLYGKMTSPYVSAYATSKFGLLGFSQVLREELKRERRIQVCTVLPGSMDTPVFQHAANYTGRAAKPPPPVGAPERVARAVVRCAERPRRRRTVGRIQQVASWGQAVLPRAYSEAVPFVMELVAIGDDARSPNDGNVFDPMPELNAVHGGWRSRSRRLPMALSVLALTAGAIGLIRRRPVHTHPGPCGRSSAQPPTRSRGTSRSTGPRSPSSHLP
jgi:short-subunit dehydrogenase